MPSALSAQGILIAYWLVILVVAAFSLRMACSLVRVSMPSWRRSFVSVLVVTLLAYLTFDFTCYLILRSLDGVYLRVPPGYSYALWFREPIGLKWAVLEHAGPLKYLPFVFGLCAAGALQLVVLQAEVSFHFGLIIFLLQWAATVVAGYILALLLGVALTGIGWTPQQPTVQAGGPSALQTIEQQVGDKVRDSTSHLAETAGNFRAQADSYLEDLKETTAPLTRHLPQPVQHFLEHGGWWWILGFTGILALLWVRSIVQRLTGAFRRSHRRKGKKRRAMSSRVRLREDLEFVGEGFTEIGPRRVVVKGLPARLRLVILSPGTRDSGELSEEMADRVLDWIKRGLAEVASYDTPGVRVWPPFYGSEGFANALQSNVPLPEPKGTKSHWVVVAGEVRIGRGLIHVGLVLYAEDANSIRFIRVKDERWLDSLAIEKTPAEVASR
jgi:hypothetical protein